MSGSFPSGLPPSLERRYRELAGEIVQAIKERRNCALIGAPSSGKTQILRMAEESLRSERRRVIYCSVPKERSGTEPHAILPGLIRQISRQLNRSPGRFEVHQAGHVWLRRWLVRAANELGSELVLLIDHIERGPEDRVRELLETLRAIYNQQEHDGGGGAGVFAVVAGALSVAKLTAGDLSPFNNIARTVHTGDLDEEVSRAIALQCLPVPLGMPPSVLDQLMDYARGDVRLITRLTQSAVDAAFEDGADAVSVTHLDQAIKSFLRHHVWHVRALRDAKQQIDADPDLLESIALLLQSDGPVPMSELPLAGEPEGDQLYLTGLVQKFEDDSYGLRNRSYRAYLETKYPPHRLGQLLMRGGRWESALRYLEAAQGKRGRDEHLLGASIDAIFAARTPHHAGEFFARALRSVFGIDCGECWLPSTDQNWLDKIHTSAWPHRPEEPTQIPLTGAESALLPQACAFRWQVVYATDDGRCIAYPLLAHRRRPVGVFIHLLRPGESQERLRDRSHRRMVAYLEQASRALYEVLERRRREETLPRVIAGITAARTPGELLVQIGQVVRFDAASIQLLNRERNALILHAGGGVLGKDAEGRRFPLDSSAQAGFTYPNVQVYREQTLLVAELTSDVPRYWEEDEYLRPPHRTAAVRSWLGVPLVVEARMIGVLTFYSFTAGEYGDEVRSWLSVIANAAAVNLHQSMERQRQQKERRLIQNMIASIGDLDEIWRLILEGAMELTGAEAGNIGLVDPDTHQIRFERLLRPGPIGPEIVGPGDRQRLEQESSHSSIQAWVATNRKSALARDVHTEEPWKHYFQVGLLPDTVAEVAVPIIHPDTAEVVGIINLESPREGAFEDRDCRLLENLATYADLAVHNARLYRRLGAASLRSAVTAIMARNMSHNVGSHVLSYLSGDQALGEIINGRSADRSASGARTDPQDAIQAHLLLSTYINTYLRERMDFIASIPSLNPAWTAVLDVISDVVEPVWGPVESCWPRLFLLLDNIARSEGLRAPDLSLTVLILDGNRPGEFDAHTYAYQSDGDRLVYRRKSSPASPPLGAVVGIFMGTTGLQAVYGLLENFIRNSAKHSPPSRLEQMRSTGSGTRHAHAETENRLHVTLEFRYNYEAEESTARDEYVEVRLHDNVGSYTEELGERINASIEAGFINSDGSLCYGAWGLKEMRICASFLRGLAVECYEEQQDPPVLRAYEAVRELGGGASSLGYAFYLPRVKDLLVFGEMPWIPEYIPAVGDLSDEGIHRCPSEDALQQSQRRGHLTHATALIDTENHLVMRYFLKHRKAFPVRALLLGGNPEAIWKDLPPGSERETGIIERHTLEGGCRAEDLELTVAGEQVPISVERPSEYVRLAVQSKWLQVIMNRLPRITILNRRLEVTRGGTRDRLTEVNDRWTDRYAGEVVLDHAWEGVPLSKIAQCRFYAPFRSAPPEALTVLLQDLLETSDQLDDYRFRRVRAFMTLLEAAMTNVLIIDERIFRETLVHRRLKDRENVLLNRYLALQNVVSMDMPDAEHLEYVDPEEPLIGQKWGGGDPIDAGISSVGRRGDLAAFLPRHFRNNVHFLIIHQTLVDTRLGGNDGLEAYLKQLGEYQPTWVIVTSGRGRPQSNVLAPFSRFLEYSNLRRYSVQDPDKVLLTQMLYALRES